MKYGVVISKPEEVKLIDALLVIAEGNIPFGYIRMDATEYEWNTYHSCVRWNMKDNSPFCLEVYYHKQELALPVLAHEVGHLMTMADIGGASVFFSSEQHRYIGESYASRWALAWLSQHGINGKRYEQCLQGYQECLDGYAPEGSKRIELPKEVEV